MQYRASRTLPELLQFWGAAGMNVDDSTHWKGINASSLHLPEPNRFIPDEFSLVCDKLEGERDLAESGENMRKDTNADGGDIDYRETFTGDATVDGT